MTDDRRRPSRRAASRARQRARRAATIDRRETYFDLLASGYSCEQIAERMGVSVASVRRAIDQAIDARRLDAPERYMHVQVARLTKALRLADASIERGDLRALAPFVRLVAALDRYHGLAPANARPAPAEAPPLALPAPPLALTYARTGRDEPPGADEAPRRTGANTPYP